MAADVLNFGRCISSTTTALVDTELSPLLRKFLFSMRYLCGRVFHYFEHICHSFWSFSITCFFVIYSFVLFLNWCVLIGHIFYFLTRIVKLMMKYPYKQLERRDFRSDISHIQLAKLFLNGSPFYKSFLWALYQIFTLNKYN